MATDTITYRIASETAGIDVDGVRFRATRSSRLPEAMTDTAPLVANGPWTLWHDDQDGGSHSVGHCDAFASLDRAIGAARRHTRTCPRPVAVPATERYG